METTSYNIYFEKRMVTICHSSQITVSTNPNAVICCAKRFGNLADTGEWMEKRRGVHNLVLASDGCGYSPESVFNEVCSGFREVNAAGGVIENSKGEILLIFRNGLWDLPKGKQEEGEDIPFTALREVEEETGIAPEKGIEPLCTTHHTYRINGEFMLKHTWWFRMKYNGNATLVPQMEENIEKALWVSPKELPEYLKATYPSIAEVIGAYMGM